MMSEYCTKEKTTAMIQKAIQDFQKKINQKWTVKMNNQIIEIISVLRNETQGVKSQIEQKQKQEKILLQMQINLLTLLAASKKIEQPNQMNEETQIRLPQYPQLNRQLPNQIHFQRIHEKIQEQRIHLPVAVRSKQPYIQIHQQPQQNHQLPNRIYLQQPREQFREQNVRQPLLIQPHQQPEYNIQQLRQLYQTLLQHIISNQNLTLQGWNSISQRLTLVQKLIFELQSKIRNPTYHSRYFR